LAFSVQSSVGGRTFQLIGVALSVESTNALDQISIELTLMLSILALTVG
jgi:hypothetical protein